MLLLTTITLLAIRLFLKFFPTGLNLQPMVVWLTA
jgi:hypothetical protein